MWGAGNYMARMSKLKDINPNMDIYTEKNAGQNWQMLLPLLYKFKCIPIPEKLFCVLVRRTSHSRGQYKTFEQEIVKFSSYRNTILATLDRIHAMSNEERGKYKKDIVAKYKIQELQLAIHHREIQAQIGIYQELKELGITVPIKHKLTWYVKQSYIGNQIIRIINKVFKW